MISDISHRIVIWSICACIALLAWHVATQTSAASTTTAAGPYRSAATAATPPAPRWISPALATWYGPGFYGHHTKCGQVYGHLTRGVASMTLPCGARLTIRHGRHTVRVRVIDSGAFRVTFDLSARTAQDLCGCWKPYTMQVAWHKGWA